MPFGKYLASRGRLLCPVQLQLQHPRQDSLLSIKFIIDYRLLRRRWMGSHTARIRNWIKHFWLNPNACSLCRPIKILSWTSESFARCPSQVIYYPELIVFCMCRFFPLPIWITLRNSLPAGWMRIIWAGSSRRRITTPSRVCGYTIWANCLRDSLLICCHSLLRGILALPVITQTLVAVIVCGKRGENSFLVCEALQSCWENLIIYCIVSSMA